MVVPRRLTFGVLVIVCAVALATAGLASGFTPKQGDLVLTYSGSGSGSYTYNVPQFDGSGGACEFAGKHATIKDTWHWTDTYWFSKNGADLHHQIVVGGTSHTDQVVSPCTANGSTNPGSTLICTAPYGPDDSANPPEANINPDHSGYELGVAMGVMFRSFTPRKCNGLTEENPYPISDMMNAPHVAITTAALSRGFKKALDHSVHHACNSVDCGYQQCENEPGSSQPGAGPVSCSAEESWKAEIKVSLKK